MRQMPSKCPGRGRFDATFLPMHLDPQSGPEGAFVPDAVQDDDRVVVIYPRGKQPPEITVESTPRGVHTVLANGVAVAVVARVHGPALAASDVVLVERYLANA